MRRRRNVDYFLKNHLSEANKKQNATKIGTNDHLIRSKIWLSGNWQHNSYKCVFWTRNTFLTSKILKLKTCCSSFCLWIQNVSRFHLSTEGGKWEKFKFPSLVVAVVFHSANASKIDFFFLFSSNFPHHNLHKKIPFDLSFVSATATICYVQSAHLFARGSEKDVQKREMGFEQGEICDICTTLRMNHKFKLFC